MQHNHYCQYCLDSDITKLSLSCNLCGYFCQKCVEIFTKQSEFICPSCILPLQSNEQIQNINIRQLVQIKRKWFVQQISTENGSINNLYEVIFSKDVCYKVQTAAFRKLIKEVSHAFQNKTTFKTTIQPGRRSQKYIFKTVPFGQNAVCIVLEPFKKTQLTDIVI